MGLAPVSHTRLPPCLDVAWGGPISVLLQQNLRPLPQNRCGLTHHVGHRANGRAPAQACAHRRAEALDITNRSAMAALPDQLPAALNGVVNNAGIIVTGPVEGLSLDDLTQQLEVNVISQIAVTQAVLPKIRDAGGRVVFISSVSGLFTTPGTGAYNASKYAIEALADALRMELRPWRIPVSLIEPGKIRTDMWGGALDDYDHLTKQLSEGHRRLYASHLAGTRKLLGRMQKLAADPKKVTKAVEHALTSRRPKRRYLLDVVSRLQKSVVAITPTAAVNDAVLVAATTSK